MAIFFMSIGVLADWKVVCGVLVGCYCCF